MANAEIKARVEALESRVAELEQEVDNQSNPTERDRFDSVRDQLADVDELLEDRSTREATVRRQVLDRIRNYERAYGSAAPIDVVVGDVAKEGHDTADVAQTIDQLVREGEIYNPDADNPDSDTVRVV